MTDIHQRIHKDEGRGDPEPIAIVTLCIGTLTMVGAVANAFINYRKYIRDHEERQEDAAVEFLSQADVLRAAGERLLHVIMLVGQNGEGAFTMATRNSHYVLRGEDSAGKTEALSLRSGETSIELDAAERERWNALIAQTASCVELMNSAVEAYEAALSSILASGRRLEKLIGVSLESVISNVVDHGIRFQKALDFLSDLTGEQFRCGG